MECVAPWNVWHHGMCGTMECVAPWNVWHHGMCGTMECEAPWNLGGRGAMSRNTTVPAHHRPGIIGLGFRV
eukprot:352754-Chlamydomonas_euryale.AAC.3